MSDVLIHPAAICESARVGTGTRIGAFAHVLPGARIGANCDIGDHVFIENQVVLGDRVAVASGVQLWDGTTLADDAFVGPNATFTNDALRSELLLTVVGAGASIGANATVLSGVTIGRNAVVDAGSVVLANVPANAIVHGNPARIRGYVNAVGAHSARPTTFAGETHELVGGARLVRLTHAQDMRGSLAAVEVDQGLPFAPRRFFVVYGVPSAEARGEHAHRNCHQFLCCLSGSVSVLVDDATDRAEVLLDDPALALYMPPMIWGTQYGYSPTAIVAVLASDPYDPGDYIRDYDEFVSLRRASATLREPDRMSRTKL